MREEERAKMRKSLRLVYEAEKEKGYRAIDQMIGYLVTDDPSYITGHRDARRVIREFDRDELMEELLTTYLGVSE